MAALTVLAIGIVGTIGVMNSAIGVAGTTGGRSKGVAVASKHIETLRAVPYDQLKLAAVAPSDPLPTPISDRVGNRTYYVIRVVTKQDEATPSQPALGPPKTNAYLKGFVSVTWEDESGFHEVHQTTHIYPGGKGVFNVAESVIPDGSSAAPDEPLTLSALPVPLEAAIDLAWTPPAPSSKPDPASWYIEYWSQYAPSQILAVNSTLPATVTTLRVSSLAALTNYSFRIYSVSAKGTRSNVAKGPVTAKTNGNFTGPCFAGSASVTPTAVKKKNASLGSGLVSSPLVVVNVEGDCRAHAFQMEYSPSVGVNRDRKLDPNYPAFDPLNPLDPTIAYPRSFSGTMPGVSDWTVGDHPVEIYSYTPAPPLAKTKRASLGLTVCAHNKQVCP